MDKPWYNSMTMVGGAVFAAIGFLEQSGAIPAGASSQLTALVQAIAALVALFGLRRAIAPKS